MAYNFNGSQTLSNSTLNQNVPLTVSFWARPTNAPGAWQDMLSIGDPGGDQYALSLAFDNSGKLNAYSYTAGGFFQSISSTIYTRNVWHHCVGVWASTSSRTSYLNGIASATATGTGTITFVRLAIASWVTLSADRLIGDMADIGIWNTALSAQEISSLSRGVSCSKIRPQNLRFYAPLIRSIQDIKNGFIISSNGGPTITTHPRIYL